MDSCVDAHIDSKNLLRLSAVLYVDSAKQYNLNQETVLIKIIESIFIGNDNAELSAEDISILIKEDYRMNFEEDKIISFGFILIKTHLSNI